MEASPLGGPSRASCSGLPGRLGLPRPLTLGEGRVASVWETRRRTDPPLGRNRRGRGGLWRKRRRLLMLGGRRCLVRRGGGRPSARLRSRLRLRRNPDQLHLKCRRLGEPGRVACSSRRRAAWVRRERHPNDCIAPCPQASTPVGPRPSSATAVFDLWRPRSCAAWRSPASADRWRRGGPRGGWQSIRASASWYHLAQWRFGVVDPQAATDRISAPGSAGSPFRRPAAGRPTPRPR